MTERDDGYGRGSPGGLYRLETERDVQEKTISLIYRESDWRRKWQPTPVFLLGESQGQEPGGLPSMGLHRVRHD